MTASVGIVLNYDLYKDLILPFITPIQKYGSLSVRHGRLRSVDGQPAVLRGISLFWSNWGGKYYTAEWVKRLALDWQVDVVRACLGIAPGGYFDNPQGEVEKVFLVIEAAIARGLYVIVDWHSHYSHTEEAIKFFSEVTSRYSGIPNIIFEVWNEPAIGLDWLRDILPYHNAVVGAIRSTGCSNIVICGTGDQCRKPDEAMLYPVPFDNICYSVHFYAASHRQGLRERVTNAINMGGCVFVSEYGLCESHGDGPLDLAEIEKWWQFLDCHGISNVNWSFNDKEESASLLTSGRFASRLLGVGLSKSGRAVQRYLRLSACRIDS